MINNKINEEFIEKKEIIGLNKSGKASLKISLLSTCLGNDCSGTGLMQVLEKMCNLSFEKGNSNDRISTRKGMV